MCYPRHVMWLSGGDFYALPVDFPLLHSQSYQQGRVYGQDVSSGAAVDVLLQAVCPQRDTDSTDKSSCSSSTTMPSSPLSSTLRILDLCCAPGQKLMALADGLAAAASARRDTTYTVVVGVDVSSDRLAVCRRAICKYLVPAKENASTASASPPTQQLASTQQPTSTAVTSSTPRIRLYCSNGTTFGQNSSDRSNLVWDSVVAQHDTATGRKRLNKSARKRQAQQLRGVADWDWSSQAAAIAEATADDSNDSTTHIQLFDAVLVDAECSTDGSVKHVAKRRRLEWTEERLPDLINLQKGLAASGFRLLKPGGTMVYATCSLSADQNERVVEWLLKELGPKAQLVPVSFPQAPPSVRAGNLEGTLRFWPSEDPKELTGGGFFLAKITKKE